MRYKTIYIQTFEQNNLEYFPIPYFEMTNIPKEIASLKIIEVSKYSHQHQ